MPSGESLSDLLLTLYSAPLSPELWPKFLAELSEMIGLGGAALLHQDLVRSQANVHVTVGIDPEAGAIYQAEYAAMDAWLPEFLTRPEGEVALADELCPPERLRKSEFYHDFLRPYDVRLSHAVPTLKRASVLEFVTFYSHGWKTKLPDRKATDLLNIVLPHLQMALRIRQRLYGLEAEKHTLEGALDRLDFGLILLDEVGRCIFLNESARHLMKQRNGLCFRNDRLGGVVPSESSQLRMLIERAVAAGGGKQFEKGGALSISRPSGSPLQLLVAPFLNSGTLDSVTGSRRAAAILFISDPDRKPVAVEDMVQLLYGFTAAEAKLARLLLDGCTLAQSAETNHVTRETVRTQLKSMFSKTGVRRQSELIRLLTALPKIRH
jgi:DNA-binding CsgD family transcriptional regulator